jgi:hypothetical protein
MGQLAAAPKGLQATQNPAAIWTTAATNTQKHTGHTEARGGAK